VEGIPIIKVSSTRNYNLRNKGPVPDTASSKNEKIPLNKITHPPIDPKLNDSTQGKTNGKTRKKFLASTNKPSTSNSTGNNTEINVVPNNNKTCKLKDSQKMNNTNTHTLDYNVIKDMKKMKSNIFMFDICSLPQ
jgi:hypothetical protein